MNTNTTNQELFDLNILLVENMHDIEYKAVVEMQRLIAINNNNDTDQIVCEEEIQDFEDFLKSLNKLIKKVTPKV